MIQVDSRGLITSIWSSNEKLNRQPDSLLGRSLSYLLGQATHRHLSPLFGRVRRTNQAEEIEYQFTLAGEARQFSARILPPATSIGKARSLFVIARDVTEQKQEEEKLRQQETLLGQAQELAGIGSWTRDLKSDDVVWSRGVYRILGLDPAGGPAGVESFRKMVHPDDRERMASEREAAIAQHRPLDSEFRCLRADGSMRIFHRRAMPFYDETGEAVRFVGMTQDVTERKNKEEKLRRSEALLAQAEEMANLGSWEFVPKTGETTVSKHLLRMYGFGPEEGWDEARYWNGLDPVDWPWIREIYEKSVSQSRPFSFSAHYRLPDGSTRIYRTKGVPVAGADGTADRIYGVVQDVTERQQQETALHRLPQELIRARDTERWETALALHETVGQTLASLKMCLGRLRDTLPEDNHRSLGLLQDSMDFAGDAMREVRVVSYLMYPAMLDEDGLAPALRWFARGFSERSGTDVKVEIAENFERCSRDIETAVFRIVQESLTNIHRYSGSRTARVSVTREGEMIRAEIQDAGCGLSTPARAGRNGVLSGVGIAGIQERARQLNGRFTIDSAPGRGTLVTVILPVAETESKNTEGNDRALAQNG